MAQWHTVTRVARAALFGLAAGLFAAGVALGVMAMLQLRVDCVGLSDSACLFERQVATGVARLQALGALGCLLVATGLAMGLRGPSARPQS